MNHDSAPISKPVPSRFSHLLRLVFVLVVFFIAAISVGLWATPASWNYELDYWFRRDALVDTEQLALIYGGNESCVTCHEAASRKLAAQRHKGLSCESCHGPLVDHVQDDKRVAAALVDRSRWQCQNCHAEQINRPERFPQFSKTGAIGKEIEKHKELDDETPCLKCHDAHDPTP